MSAPSGTGPKVSVIVVAPELNDFGRRCLDGLLALRGEETELIFVPDRRPERAARRADRRRALGRRADDRRQAPDRARARERRDRRADRRRRLSAPELAPNAVATLDEDAAIAAVAGPTLTPPDDSELELLGGRVYASPLVSGPANWRYTLTDAADVDDAPSVNLVDPPLRGGRDRLRLRGQLGRGHALLRGDPASRRPHPLRAGGDRLPLAAPALEAAPAPALPLVASPQRLRPHGRRQLPQPLLLRALGAAAVPARSGVLLRGPPPQPAQARRRDLPARLPGRRLRPLARALAAGQRRRSSPPTSSTASASCAGSPAPTRCATDGGRAGSGAERGGPSRGLADAATAVAEPEELGYDDEAEFREQAPERRLRQKSRKRGPSGRALESSLRLDAVRGDLLRHRLPGRRRPQPRQLRLALAHGPCLLRLVQRPAEARRDRLRLASGADDHVPAVRADQAAGDVAGGDAGDVGRRSWRRRWS